MLALVNLGQAVVPIEVLRLGQHQLLEDLFGALGLVGLERRESIVPPLEVVVFCIRADLWELKAYVLEMNV